MGMAGRVVQRFYRNDSVPLCSYDAGKHGSSGSGRDDRGTPGQSRPAGDRGAFLLHWVMTARSPV
jgi:hypothetical protein